MVHCQMPLLSLLCLLGPLLWLAPQLTLGFPGIYKKLTLADKGLQKALAFALPQLNQNRIQDANYFRVFKVDAFSRAYTQFDYLVDGYFLKTECKKTPGKLLTYREIQQCKAVPGKPQIQFCPFKVVIRPIHVDRSMNMTRCI